MRFSLLNLLFDNPQLLLAVFNPGLIYLISTGVRGNFVVANFLHHLFFQILLGVESYDGCYDGCPHGGRIVINEALDQLELVGVARGNSTLVAFCQQLCRGHVLEILDLVRRHREGFMCGDFSQTLQVDSFGEESGNQAGDAVLLISARFIHVLILSI